MKRKVKHYKAHTLDELHDIYRNRVSVFVVEQNCPYQEIDGNDKVSCICSWITDHEGIADQRLLYLPFETPFANQYAPSAGYSERFIFTGNDPRKGNRAPLNQIKYSEERDEEKEMSGGHFASERGEEPRSGIQYCSSLSFTNFGARYMDNELMTYFISVDRYADKYPFISPYAYCVWNPLRLIDPDGDSIAVLIAEKAVLGNGHMAMPSMKRISKSRLLSR